MLQAIRDKVTGWIAYGIIFLISIPFALWGVNSYLGGGEVLPAASVNGEEITQGDLDRAYASYRNRLTQLFGGTIPTSFGSEAMLREQVLGQMIEEVALRQYIDEARYRIGDDELNRIIRGMQAFQAEGSFDPESYQAQIASLGYSPVGFEQELRQTQAMRQFEQGILKTAFTVPRQRKRFASLSNQRRKIRTLTHTIERSSIDIDDAQIEQHYLANTDRFRTQEQARIDYIEINLENVKRAIRVDPAAVRARYEENLAAYSTPEIRSASHILLKADAQNSDTVLARIKDIRERIVNGENFADLAREISEDPGSAADGGSLGEIERGVMVQAFEDVLYGLQAGELSEPVLTSFGWHLIQLKAIEGGEVQSFESLRSKLEDEIKSELAESQIFDLVDNLANLAYEQADSLLPAAEQLELKLQTSDWFDRFSGEGIAAEARVRQAAFSEDVYQHRRNSEAIELPGGRVVFIRINEIKPPVQLPLEEVRKQIKNELLQVEAVRRNNQAGSVALAQLNSGKSLEALAKEWPASVIDRGFVDRRDAQVDPSLLNKAFSMAKPEHGPVYAGLSLANGGYTIIELSAVLANDSEVEAEALDKLSAASAAAEYQTLIKLLSRRAEVIRTPQEELN